MRPTVSVIVPLRSPESSLQAWLVALRATLGLRDEVVLVDCAPQGGAAAGVFRHPRTAVVDAAGADTWHACDIAMEVATGQIVVTLASGTRVPGRWLDSLLAPLGEGGVGATCPQHLAGQAADVHTPSAGSGGRAFQAVARAWRQEHRGRFTAVDHVKGDCVALRRETLDRIGGFGPGGMATLPQRLAHAGRHIAVAQECLVHQPEPSVPRTADASVLVSACLIVKDEAKNLPSCLAALTETVDEVIVYDTGSSDDTSALARAAGATVIDGYWDDDFAGARNRALEHCRGTWILHVDADEVLQADAGALRAQLAADACPDVLEVAIDNLDDSGGLKFAHAANRLFRRRSAHWQGRLHEQVVARRARPLTRGATEHARITHSGYTTEVLVERSKHDRNLRIAKLGADADGGRDASAVLNLARALSAAGQYTDSVQQFARARTLTNDPVILRQSLRIGAETLLAAGRPEEALRWIADLRKHTRSASVPDYLEGTALMNLGDIAGALLRFENIEDAVDEDFRTPLHLLQLRRGLTLAAGERWPQACAELLAVLRVQPTAHVWGPLAESLWRAGQSADEPVQTVTPDLEVSVMAQVLTGPAQAADPIGEALWQRSPGNPRVLAFGLQIAPQLALPRALEWSIRLREAGLAEECPLLHHARNAANDGLDRMRFAATAFAAFGDERGRDLIRTAAGDLDANLFRAGLLVLDELTPELLPALIEAAASTPGRSRAMAEVLASFGAHEQAAAVLARAAA